jgi:hypothetical protein
MFLFVTLLTPEKSEGAVENGKSRDRRYIGGHRTKTIKQAAQQRILR